MICTLQRTVSTTKTYNFDWFSATLFVPNFETGNAIPRQQLLPSLRHYRINFAAFLTLWYYGCMFSVFLLQYFQTSFICRYGAFELRLRWSFWFFRLFCWHTRENWTKMSICGFVLMTLIYIVYQFGNIRSLRDWCSIHQISDFRHGAKYKFSLGTTCKRVNLDRSWL